MQNLIQKACAGLMLIVAIAVADDNSRRLTNDQAVRDVKTFLSMLESTHPDPYTNLGGKVAFKRTTQQLVRDVPSGGVTVGELADLLSAFILPLKDIHTKVIGSGERWVDTSPRLAVQFSIASDDMWIAGSDIPELKGLRGYKLMAVNGHSLPDMLRLVNAQLSQENIYGSYSNLDQLLHSYKKLKNVLPDLEHSSGVTYTLTSPQGTTVKRTVPWGGEHPVSVTRWSDQPVRWSEITLPGNKFGFAFIDNGRTGYFRVPHMEPREMFEIMKGYHVGDLKARLESYYRTQKKEMPADIDAAIAGIPSLNGPGAQLLEEMKRRNTPNLVIDMRGSGGGSTPVIEPFFYRIWGDAYFGARTNVEFVTVHSPLYLEQRHTTLEEEKRKDPNFELGQYKFETENAGATAEQKRKDQFQEWTEAGLDWSKPMEALGGKPFYRPLKVVVLCDSGTISAAFEAVFAAHLAGATIVGVPSVQSPNAFMSGTGFVLPASGIKGWISNSVQTFMPNDPRANIFHPDFEVTYAIFAKYDFDRETTLRYALDLLANGKI